MSRLVGMVRCGLSVRSDVADSTRGRRLQSVATAWSSVMSGTAVMAVTGHTPPAIGRFTHVPDHASIPASSLAGVLGHRPLWAA